LQVLVYKGSKGLDSEREAKAEGDRDRDKERETDRERIGEKERLK
jgi:hypothetical protein